MWISVELFARRNPKNVHAFGPIPTHFQIPLKPTKSFSYRQKAPKTIYNLKRVHSTGREHDKSGAKRQNASRLAKLFKEKLKASQLDIDGFTFINKLSSKCRMRMMYYVNGMESVEDFDLLSLTRDLPFFPLLTFQLTWCSDIIWFWQTSSWASTIANEIIVKLIDVHLDLV